MKKHWIEYKKDFPLSPMTMWVHRGQPGKRWFDNQQQEYSPPLPKPVAGKGFAAYFVELDGFTFEFSSFAEIEEMIKVLSQKNLPTSTQLARRVSDKAGPNSHWLSRLPAEVKAWKYRQKAVKYLKQAELDFKKEAERPA